MGLGSLETERERQLHITGRVPEGEASAPLGVCDLALCGLRSSDDAHGNRVGLARLGYLLFPSNEFESELLIPIQRLFNFSFSVSLYHQASPSTWSVSCLKAVGHQRSRLRASAHMRCGGMWRS